MKNKSLITIIFVFTLQAIQLHAQVGIGTDNPSPAAILHLESADKGLIIPKLSTALMQTMISKNPPTGTLVFNTDSNEIYMFNASDNKWYSLTPFIKQLYPGFGNRKDIEINNNAKVDNLKATQVNATTVNATNGNGITPLGGIILWSGTVPPSGWALCNGDTVNGYITPDLRNRFVVGYNPYDGRYNQPGNLSTKGTNTGNIGGLDNVTLTESQMPSHRHSGNTNTDGAHQHTGHVTARADNDDNDTPHNFLTYNNVNYYFNTININSNGSAHSHAFTTNYTGGNQAHENRPPFYTLAYIMRVQ